MKDNSTIKEKSLQPVQPVEIATATAARPAVRQRTSETTIETLDDRILSALNAASEKKALDLVLLDLRDIATFTDYFLISSGANQRQVQAIADEVVDKLKKSGTPAARIEGYRTAEWILVDYGDFVVHVFEDKARKFYDLERLWRESKRVELPAAMINATVSSLRNEL
jgi:ribosome-associated protein